MVASPSKLLAVPALLAACTMLAGVDGTSILNNPITIMEAVVPMDHQHPAYGGPPRRILPSVVLDNTDEERAAGAEITNSSAIEILTAASRKLEGAPTDMEKLEKHFGKKLEDNYKTLLSKYGKGTPTNMPWPASYWPIYMDSINHKWKAGEGSPAEKYAKAFGKDVKQFMDRVSQVNGVESFNMNKKCSSDKDCSSLTDGSRCAMRTGAKSGYCIPTWYGICHAWAPASNWEPEPKCDVVKNGVTFRPYDLKGLMTAVYDGAAIETVFTGSRFYGPDTAAAKDKYGRFLDATRRDLGAGFFHLAIANIMGVNGHSFVVDVTAASEVWNQPVRSYEVLKSEIMTPAQAGKQYFGTTDYPFNNAAKFLAYTKTRFAYIIEAYEDGPLVPHKLDAYTTTVDYEYFVELDANYNIIGGEWLGNSRYEHPDFLWFATGTPNKNAVTNIGLSYKEVRALIDESIACKGTKTSEPTTVAPTKTPAPTTTKPDFTTPVPTTAKPDATTAAPKTETPAPSSSVPATKDTPAPTTVKPIETPAPSTGKPGKPTEAPVTPAPGKPEPTTGSPSSGKPTDPTPAPPAGKPGKPTEAPVTPAPGKPEPTTGSPSSGKPTDPTFAPPGKVTPPGSDDDDDEDDDSMDVPPAAAGKPTVEPVDPATPSATTASPTDGKATVSPPGGDDGDDDDDDEIPTPAQSTPAPAGGKGTISPPAGDEDSDDVAPPSGVVTPSVTPAPASGAGKPTPPTSGDNSVPTPAPTKKQKKHKECHA